MRGSSLRALVASPRMAVLVGLVMAVTVMVAPLAVNNSVTAAPIDELNFQARLLNDDGSLVDDGTYNVEFKLYDSAAAGGSAQGVCVGGGTDDCVWLETRTGGNQVTVTNGYLYANLGEVTAFASTIDWSEELWLTINIGGTGAPSWDGEMTPRLKLTSVPHAFNSDLLDNLDSTDLVQLAQGEQAVNEAGTLIAIDQAGAGDILDLQVSNSQVLGLDNSGNLTVSGTGVFQGASLTVGSTTQAGTLILNENTNDNTVTIATGTQATGSFTVSFPDGISANDTFCLQSEDNCAGTGDLLQDGNSFGTALRMGTNDTQNVIIETDDTIAVTVDTSQNVTLVGTLAVNGDQITADGATLVINAGGDVDIQDDVTVDSLTTDTGDVTSAGDVAVNGGDITTDDATFNLINTTATTVNFAGAATTLSVGAGTGTTTINNDLDVTGTALFNSDVDLTLADTENLSVTNTVTGTNAVDLVSTVLTNNTSSGTQRVAVLQNAAGTGTTESILTLDNADTDTGVADGLVVTSAAGTITDGIDVSDSDITNALNVGGNIILGTTAVIDFDNFDVDASGNVTTAGTLAVNGDSITADGATLTINAAGAVDIQDNLTADSLTLDTGSLTISGVATDITTGAGEDLTVVANGAGVINLNDTVVLGAVGAADNDTVLCRNSSNELAACNSTFLTSANAFIQNGNSFGATAVLGTNDTQSLQFETDDTLAVTIDTSQNVTLVGTLAVNGDSITADGATLTINAGGAVDIQDNVTVDSLTTDVGDITSAGDVAVNGGDITSTQATLNINAAGAVDIQDNLTADSLTLDTAGLTVSGVATDITTGTNEDLTIVANGVGEIILNDTVQIPTLAAADSDTLLCRNTSNELATCSSTFASQTYVTLQNAYTNGNSISTGDGSDIDITLSDQTNDSNFDIDIAADNTVSISRVDNASTEAPAQLLLLENLDTNLTVANGINITDAGGVLTDAIDVSDDDIVNAINVGANTILGTSAVIDFTNFDVDGSGNITTAGTLAVNGDSITSDGATLTINAAGAIDLQDAVTADSLTLDTGSLTISGVALDITTGAGEDLDLQANGAGIIHLDDTVRIGSLDCSGNLNGGALTTNGSGDIICSDDEDSGSATVTLQDAYEDGNSITTAEADGDLDVILADTASDQNFDIDIVADNTVSISRTDNASTEAPAQLLLVENLDTNLAIGDGLAITDAGGGLTDAIDVSDADITNAINVGPNTILGTTAVIDFTNFDVDASGNITTAGTLAVNGDSITSDGATLTVNAGGAIDLQDAVTADSLTLDTGSLTISGVATDITTGSNEDLTLQANGSGEIILNDTVQIPTLGAADSATYLCRNSSNELATCNTTGAGAAFVQGGNSFGATAVLGTNDAQSLQFEVGGVDAAIIADGGAVTFQNETDSNFGFRVLDADGGIPILSIDTTDEQVGIGGDATYTANFKLGIRGGDVTIGEDGEDAYIELISDGLADATTSYIWSQDAVGLAFGAGAGVAQVTLADTGNTGQLTVNVQQNDTADLVVQGDTIANLFVVDVSDEDIDIAGALNANADVNLGDAATDTISFVGQADTDFTFDEGGDRTISIEARASNAAGRGLTLSAGDAGAGGSPFGGGQLTLQGGDAAGTGNAAGGNVLIEGGAGTGTGTQGLVVVENLAVNFIANSICNTDCTIDQANIDGYSQVIVDANAAELEIIVPDPSIDTTGRLIYITAANGSNDFTLTLNDGEANEVNIGLRENETATLIWNGGTTDDWTGAGASSSTTLQSAYNNTLTSAGGAEIVLNAPGGSADGLTIRNNDITPINGGILEVQSSIGTNLFSVNNIATEYAANGGAEDSGSFSTDWTSVGSATVSHETTTIATGTGAAQFDTTAAANDGIRNNLATDLAVSTQYLVSFTARTDTGDTWNSADVEVYYSRNGGGDVEACTNASTENFVDSGWRKFTCTITTDATTATNADLIIRQTDATARTVFIDNLSINENSSSSVPDNVQIGGGQNGGPITLFTLDRASAPPVADGNQTYLGSMYYDTTTGRIQCYEADGWGACGSPPNNIITLTPEYAGSVLNGSGVGTMQADFCADESGELQINATLCDTGEAVNYYEWTSPQATAQEYSILLTFQLPTTFDGFIDNNTITLDARSTDASNSDVGYEIFRSTGSAITECGSETIVTTNDNEWQTVSHTGDESDGCSFAAGDRVIFKINMTAQDNDFVYASDINFTYTND